MKKIILHKTALLFATCMFTVQGSVLADATRPADTDEIKYYTPFEEPFRLSGFAFFAADKVYRRLPVAPDKKLPSSVDRLAWNTAGGQMAFRSNTKRIVLVVKTQHNSIMYHMAQTGSAGFDLYTGEPGRRLFSGVTKFKAGSMEYSVDIFKNDRAVTREFLINFPLYSGVESVFIGLDSEAQVSAPTPWADARPIVVYGTSITQGGCASRPGMAYSNILSRKLNQPFINLGFSGSGCGESEVVDEVVKIKDPALFILDYEANTKNAALMARTMPYFIKAIRASHPIVPIMILTKIRYAKEAMDTVPSDNAPLASGPATLRETQRKIFEEFSANDRNIYFVDGSTILGDEWDEATVDGVHPNDFGFYRMARSLLPEIKRILK